MTGFISVATFRGFCRSPNALRIDSRQKNSNFRLPYVQRRARFLASVDRIETDLPLGRFSEVQSRPQGAASLGPIHLVACDMDGTMLDREVKTSPQNIAAVQRLLAETDVLFVPATGKSRGGALRSMGPLGEHLTTVHPKGCPGVFLQGLIVFGTDGEIIYENKCEESLSESVVSVAQDLDLDLIAYSRDDILSERRSHFTDLLPSYHEPQVQEIGNWQNTIASRTLNKFIYMAEPAHIDRIRPIVAEKIGSAGVLTQAQSNMLEVLPPNSSKGDGVRRLLDNLSISPENVLAIGDAENDLEMLSMVAYSCAVANALPSVKEVARFTDIRSNNDSGVAHALERFILGELNAQA